MTRTTKAKPPALPVAPGCPDDPVRAARWRAIQAAGGASHVARAMGFKKGESVRLWYVDRDPTPEQARKLVAMTDGAIKLQQILPEAFAGLTVHELGYQPT